jgi:hypothetical protein
MNYEIREGTDRTTEIGKPISKRPKHLMMGIVIMSLESKETRCCGKCGEGCDRNRSTEPSSHPPLTGQSNGERGK